MLSGLDLSITHYSRAVSYDYKLMFTSPPISVNQAPGELQYCQQNADFVTFYDFLEGNLQFLQLLGQLDDKDITRRQEKLTMRLLEERLRLEGIRSSCWEVEKARAGLYSGSLNYGSFKLHLVSTKHRSRTKRFRQPFLLVALLLVVVLHTLSSVS